MFLPNHKPRSPAFEPASLLRQPDARLASVLSAARGRYAAKRADEVRAAVVEFAAAVRDAGVPPEHLVIALKEVFRRLDGRTPSLADYDDVPADPRVGAECGEWYPLAFAVAIDTYFAHV